MRLLDRSVGLIDLKNLGFPKQYLADFCQLLARPHGIVLVSGPTGSGKTTTLYAALNRIYSAEKNAIALKPRPPALSTCTGTLIMRPQGNMGL